MPRGRSGVCGGPGSSTFAGAASGARSGRDRRYPRGSSREAGGPRRHHTPCRAPARNRLHHHQIGAEPLHRQQRRRHRPGRPAGRRRRPTRLHTRACPVSLLGEKPAHPLVVGGVVVLHGDYLRHALLAIQHIIGRRRREHLPVPAEWSALEVALAQAMSAGPQSDAAAQSVNETWLSTREVADRTGWTERHARRRAGQLDGRREGGRWLIPETAVREHMEGQQRE